MEAELELFRDNVRRFLSDRVAPHYEDWERAGIMPRELWRELGDAGLLCVDTPEQWGGAGADFAFSCAILEETARMGFMSLATNLAVHSDIVAPYLFHLGSEQQKAQWLPRLASGEAVGAIAMTEPGAGSDLQAIRTSAVPDGDGWRISGQKTFITNGQHADLVITAVKTDPDAGARGITLMLIDVSLPGFSRGRNLEKIGQHAGDTSELFFEDVRVGPEAVLGRIGGGFGHLMDELPRERLALGVTAIGAAEGCIEQTIEYVQQRRAFGQPLAKFQNTRFELARMKTELEVHRAFVDQCARAYAEGRLDAATAAMVKLSATEMQFRVADGCLQLFGGYGYMTEYPVARAFVDARVQRIYGGTSEIMKEVIARSLLGR